jgi:hypothetical protein
VPVSGIFTVFKIIDFIGAGFDSPVFQGIDLKKIFFLKKHGLIFALANHHGSIVKSTHHLGGHHEFQ